MSIKIKNSVIIDDDRNIVNVGVTTTSTLNVGTGGTIINTTTSGNVGLGVTNPTTKLDVEGSINSSGPITINGTNILTTASDDSVALAIALG